MNARDIGEYLLEFAPSADGTPAMPCAVRRPRVLSADRGAETTGSAAAATRSATPAGARSIAGTTRSATRREHLRSTVDRWFCGGLP